MACAGDTGPTGPAGAAGSPGTQGAKGDPGARGDPGAQGDPGAPGAGGQAGVACWDQNENGLPDIATEDRNADGEVDALDCLGAAGASGTNGHACWDLDGNGVADLTTEDANGDGAVNVADCRGESGSAGADGQPGQLGLSCWDLNGNGAADVLTEDLDGNTVVDVRDCAGLSTGNVVVEVVDLRTRATLGPVGTQLGAEVWIDPAASAARQVDASGRVAFSRLPVGIYWVGARAPALEQNGALIEQSPRWVDSTPVAVSVTAGSNSFLSVGVGRSPENLQLTSLHDSAIASGALYVDSNCTTCHGDRANERSLDPARARWHSIRNSAGANVHVALPCTTCHTARVDILEESSASLRKQVDIANCGLCHANYPVFP